METKITVNDIKEKVLMLEKKIETFRETELVEIFNEYDLVDDINNLKHQLENCTGGRYDFDESDWLIYGVKIPDHIVDLPFINDYLTQDYAFISKTMGGHKDIYIAQNCGPCICINYSHNRSDYFIYDHKAQEIVLQKNLSWFDDIYISAKLEEYQNSKGCFGDIVVIDSYYGSYAKHFKRSEEVTEDNFKEIIKRYEAKYLNKEEEF